MAHYCAPDLRHVSQPGCGFCNRLEGDEAIMEEHAKVLLKVVAQWKPKEERGHGYQGSL